MSQMPEPLFEPGDHVRYTAPGGCQIGMKVGTVHHPSGTGDGYRYDGFEVDHPGSVYQITGAPETSLVLITKREGGQVACTFCNGSGLRKGPCAMCAGVGWLLSTKQGSAPPEKENKEIPLQHLCTCVVCGGKRFHWACQASREGRLVGIVCTSPITGSCDKFRCVSCIELNKYPLSDSAPPEPPPPDEPQHAINYQVAINHQVVVDEAMIDRYIDKAIEYGTFESLPPFRDRVRGLLRSALGQP